MKKFLIVFALATVSFANAQKGTYLVLGNVGFYSSKDSNESSESKTNRFSFSPKIGYQFKDNWAVGIETGFSSDKNVYTYQENESNNQERIAKNFSAGAFVRYSKSISDLFFVYADLGTGYIRYKETNSNNFSSPTTFTEKGNGFYANIDPAVAININKGFAINFSFGGLQYNVKNSDNDTKESSFYFTFGQTFTAGISKNF